MFIKILVTLIISLPAYSQVEDIPGCSDLKTATAVSRLGIGHGNYTQEDHGLMIEAEKALCSKFTPSAGSTVFYSNGRVATYSARQKGQTWYYSNGRPITFEAGVKGVTWLFPNDKTVSFSMGEKQGVLYYPNGQALTFSTGEVGATWYYPNGKVISFSMGSKGATWYYSNGNVLNFNGPELSEEELLNPFELLTYLADTK